MLSYLTVLRVSLYLILACLFLTPSIVIGPGLPAVRLEEAVIVAVIGYAIMASLSGVPIQIVWGLRQTLLVVFVAFLLVSINTGLYLGYGGSLGDLNQLIRIIKYIAIYTICVSAINLSADSAAEKIRILKFMLWLSMALLIIAIQQHFDLLGLNALYADAVAPVHGEFLAEGRSTRAIGMIGNPNELGFLFVLAALVAAYLLSQGFRVVYVLLVAANVYGIFLSGSRTSFVACAAGASVMLVLALTQWRGVRLNSLIRANVVLTAIVAGGAASLSASQPTGDGLFGRFKALSDPTEASSWQARLERWDTNLAMFLDSPLLGVGPLRRVDMLAGDNEWLLLLRSYGILGTMVLVLACLLPHLRSARTETRTLGAGVLVATAVYMLPAAVFHSLVLMPIVFMVLALSETTVRRKAW